MPVELAEDEQWRLINESGILQKVSTKKEDEEEEDYPLAEEIFSAVTLIIPFSFLLLMMDMCVLSLVLMLKWTYLAQSNPSSIREATDYTSHC